MTRLNSHWPLSLLSSSVSLINLFVPLILVRLLPPEQIGLYKVFFLYLAILPAVTFASGISSGIAYWTGQAEPAGTNAIRASGAALLALALASATVLALCAVPIAERLSWSPELVLLFAAAALGTVGSILFEEASIARGEVWRGAVFGSLFELLRSLSIIAVAALTRRIDLTLGAYAAVSLLKALIGSILSWQRGMLGRFPIARSLRGVCVYAAPVSSAWLFGVLFNHADQLLLSTVLSGRDFAVYSLGCLVVPPLLILEQSVMRVAIPQMAEALARGKAKDAAAMHAHAMRSLAFFLIPSSLGLAIFAEPIVTLLFTARYSDAAPILRLFALSYLLLIVPPDAVARARGNGRWILTTFMLWSLLALLLTWNGASWFGALGALTAILAVKALMRIYALMWTAKSEGWSITEFIPTQSIMSSLLAGLLASAAAYLVRLACADDLWWLLIGGVIFGAVYLPVALRTSAAMLRRRKYPSVLFVTQTLDIGGLERMVLNLCEELQRRKAVLPRMLCYDHPTKPDSETLVADFRERGVETIVHRKRPGFSIRVAMIIARQVITDEITIVHVHDLGGLIYGCFAWCLTAGSFQLVMTQHSFVHLASSPRYRRYERFFSQLPHRIIAVSNDIKRQYQELGIGAVTVIENGVPFKPRAPSAVEITSARQILLRGQSPYGSRISPGDTKLWIVYLARLHPQKGQRFALDIWRELPSQVRERAALHIVGPESVPGERDHLCRAAESLISKGDTITIWGGSTTPQLWLTAGDLFLSCSEYEGMPLGPLEAIGNGMPACLSDIPGHQMLSPPAALLDPNPSRAAQILAERISHLLSDLPAMRQGAWQDGRELRARYGIERMADRYLEVYAGLCV